MSITKSTSRENLTKMPSGWVLAALLTVKIKLRCPKSTALGKDPDLDPYQIERQDPDSYQSEKQDPDTCQNGLDPQHCYKRSA